MLRRTWRASAGLYLLLSTLPQGSRSQTVFTSSSDLENAVNDWLADEQQALTDYGDISGWDVSRITTMEQLFNDASTFNGNIGSWDVSKVTNMVR
jgi:surface protein